MKLTIAQALGTVLNIQEVPGNGISGPTTFYVYRDMTLGDTKEMTLDQVVWKAIEIANFKDECHFAIFPIGSGREDYYMTIEREMLRQEASVEFNGKKMWEMFGQDPRELVTAIMEQMRECAQTVVSPVHFQVAMIRVGVLVIASLQWISDWIGRLKVRHAHLTSTQQEPPKVIEMPKTDPLPSEPTPALFGPTGLSVIEPSEKEGMQNPVEPADDGMKEKEEQGEAAQEENN